MFNSNKNTLSEKIIEETNFEKDYDFFAKYCGLNFIKTYEKEYYKLNEILHMLYHIKTYFNSY
jgi:hypothetical protein